LEWGGVYIRDTRYGIRDTNYGEEDGEGDDLETGERERERRKEGEREGEKEASQRVKGCLRPCLLSLSLSSLSPSLCLFDENEEDEENEAGPDTRHSSNKQIDALNVNHSTVAIYALRRGRGRGKRKEGGWRRRHRGNVTHPFFVLTLLSEK
jgi:hypothetical protein